MARRTRNPETLPTVWRVPDDLWAQIRPILDASDPPKATGRPRVPLRLVLDTLIYRLRSGCQWNQLPQDLADDSTAHRTLQRWVALGIWDRLWATIQTACAELGGVDWAWQAADAMLGKARMGGDLVGPNPTDRGKGG
tara:strand:+ start:74 stop:487 length:414 start_codon:yes stop_codon:yes gene_type:complete